MPGKSVRSGAGGECAGRAAVRGRCFCGRCFGGQGWREAGGGRDPGTGGARAAADHRAAARRRDGDRTRGELRPTAAAQRGRAAQLRGQVHLAALSGPGERQVRAGRRLGGDPVRRAVLCRGARRRRQPAAGHGDRNRGGADRPAPVHVPGHPCLFNGDDQGSGRRVPGLRAAVGRSHQRDARGADRVGGGVVPGQRAALERGGRAPGAVVPGRPEQVAAAARQPGVLHRQAQAGGSFRGGPDREPVRPDDDPFPVAGRAAACAGGLPARARAALLVSAAPGLERQADALGLADRPDRSAAADRAAGGRHLRHRRVPDHAGPGVGYSLALAGEHAGASEGDLLPRPGLGGLPAGRVARAGLPGGGAGARVLRLPAGAVGRPAAAERAQAHAARAPVPLREQGLRRGGAG